MINAVKLLDETSDIAVVESREGGEDACVAEHVSSARNGICAEQCRIFCSRIFSEDVICVWEPGYVCTMAFSTS